MSSPKRRRRSTALLATLALSFSLTACIDAIDFSGIDFSGVDFSGLFDLPAPAPSTETIEYYDISTTPYHGAGTFSSMDSDTVLGSKHVAIAANIAEVAARSVSVSVNFEGHADMRCTEATWDRENGAGDWCTRSPYPQTAQGRRIGMARATTMYNLVWNEVYYNHPAARGKWSGALYGPGEIGHSMSAAQCRANPDSTGCRHDRRVDVYVSSRTCAAVCDATPTGSDTYLGGSDDAPVTPDVPVVIIPPTCLELGNCPVDPTPTIGQLKTTATAFTWAQQGSDQPIRFAPATITCNGSQTTVCGVPTSGEMRTGVAGPYITSSTLSNFRITPPSGYGTPAQYRIIAQPGTNANVQQTALLRFYNATPAGKSYSYTASLQATVRWDSWQWNGSSMTVTSSSTQVVDGTVSCTPASCSFGVLGSNTSR
jgi:hypothetical protein